MIESLPTKPSSINMPLVLTVENQYEHEGNRLGCVDGDR